MKTVVILTGSELRHDFFRKAIGLSTGITILKTYCEGLEKSLLALTEAKGESVAALELNHLKNRMLSEEDFFGFFNQYAPDNSNPTHIARGTINNDEYVREIQNLHPDLLVSYGCSIIKDPLITSFKKRFLNVHLGLSPYYRGSGTNFWPLVNGEPEFIGATFMHIDQGVDTGEIIHQIRARIYPHDTSHQIGNRLIGDMTRVYAQIICQFNLLFPVPQPAVPPKTKFYRKKDFTHEAVRTLHKYLASGLISTALKEWNERCLAAPIVQHPRLKISE